jgi:hypothetical protein
MQPSSLEAWNLWCQKLSYLKLHHRYAVPGLICILGFVFSTMMFWSHEKIENLACEHTRHVVTINEAKKKIPAT